MTPFAREMVRGVGALLLGLCLLGAAAPALAADGGPRLAVGFDAGDTLINGIVTGALDDASLLVFPLELQAALSDRWGLSATVLLRVADSGEYYDVTQVAYSIGPRLSLSRRGLGGWFVCLELGLGHTWGVDFDDNKYKRHDLIVQPEVGYAWTWGSPGLFISLSAGLRSMVFLSEKPEAVDWDGIGKMTHFYQPLLNLTVGLGL